MDFSKYGDNNLLYTSFNQSNDCIIFGTKTGFYVYTINPFKKIIARKIPGGVSLATMLYKSNIVIFVGNVDKGLYPKKKLIIWDDHKRTVIGEILFKYNILNIKVTKKNIIVITLKKIYIYNFENLNLIKTIETRENPKGLCAITYDDECYISYPGDLKGEVNITKYKEDYLKVIKAHVNDIEKFNIDSTGKYLVTSSQVGTLIRIYDINSSVLLKELRRGSDQAKIVDLKFSNDNGHLLCSSIKGTIHVFSTCLNKQENNNISVGYGISYIQSILPSYFSSEWSFVQFYLSDICTYSMFKNDRNEIISIGDNGCFYILSYDDKKANIVKTYKFISDEDDPFNDRTTTIK